MQCLEWEFSVTDVQNNDLEELQNAQHSIFFPIYTNPGNLQIEITIRSELGYAHTGNSLWSQFFVDRKHPKGQNFYK